jgi:hypothetical protein
MGRERELERLLDALRGAYPELFAQAGLGVEPEALEGLYEELVAERTSVGLGPLNYRLLALGVTGGLLLIVLAVVVFTRGGGAGRGEVPKADITLADEAAGREGGQLSLTYGYSREGDKVVIDYEMPYLELLAKGGLIPETEQSPRLFDWRFPALAVKIVNNTENTLFLTEAAVEVKAAGVNREPVLMVERAGAYDRLRFWNEGWGTVVDPVMRFDVVSEEACEGKDFWPEETHTLELESFAEEQQVVVTDFIPAEILDVKSVQSRASMETKYACVLGTLAYSSEGDRDYRVRFGVLIQLAGSLVKPPVFSSFEYDLFLEAGRSGYTKRLALSQAIKAGEAEQFSIKVGTDRSADFELGFAFQTSTGGVVPANAVGVSIFVPRTAVPADLGEEEGE